eukprot:TRINITY_DN7700_c0_g1_i1.p1 TRINITY_DN7700_c0_g1~~TRINITY_DN7700_c0_g1_i1.p1  ORF type:complete len:279 (+),score=76.37 TRINITY_DN7700_c0_g1_i1:54-890(+)
MLTKEYRICMPLSVDEYRVGQLYMIAKHSAEQSRGGEGVEVVENRPHTDPVHGEGRFTEKRIHLSSRLPAFVKSLVPRVFYVTEKAWNYYPFTITEYTCSFVPSLSIYIQTKYENNNGSSDNSLNLSDEVLKERSVDVIDILKDSVADHHYKESEDLRYFTSAKTKRGPLPEDWMNKSDPIMCSYKNVEVKLDIWGLQGRIESYIQNTIREILLVGHKQAFAWIDDWYGMTEDEVREYESQMQSETNEKVKSSAPSTPNSDPSTPGSTSSQKSWFSWS